MENPIEKKPFPWKWAALGCGVLVVGAIGVAVVALIAVMLVPAVRTRLANQAPIVNPLPLPGIKATPVPNSGSGNGSGNGALPFQFSALSDPSVLANQSLMEQMVASLNLNNDTDFMAPKSYKGTTTLDPSASFTLGNGWCAKDDATLKQNLAKIQFTYSINGTNVDLSKYPNLYFTDDQGHSCAMTGISITPTRNLSGIYRMVLTQKFLSPLDDGITSSQYPAGDVTLDFNVEFRSPGNPGSST